MPTTDWRKSSFSAEPDDNCVEVAFAASEAAVRDSKNPIGPRLVVPPATLRTLARWAAESHE